MTIRTPDGWKVRREEGFDATAPNYSFTLPPLEVYDQSRGLGRWTEPDYDDSQWGPAVALAGPLPWGELQPRSVPFATNREMLPERVVSVGRLSGRRGPVLVPHAVLRRAPSGVRPPRQGPLRLHRDSTPRGTWT